MSDEITLRRMLRRAHDLIISAGRRSWMDETNEWRASAHAWLCDLEVIIEDDLADEEAHASSSPGQQRNPK